MNLDTLIDDLQSGQDELFKNGYEAGFYEGQKLIIHHLMQLKEPYLKALLRGEEVEITELEALDYVLNLLKVQYPEYFN